MILEWHILSVYFVDHTLQAVLLFCCRPQLYFGMPPIKVEVNVPNLLHFSTPEVNAYHGYEIFKDRNGKFVKSGYSDEKVIYLFKFKRRIPFRRSLDHVEPIQCFKLMLNFKDQTVNVKREATFTHSPYDGIVVEIIVNNVFIFSADNSVELNLTILFQKKKLQLSAVQYIILSISSMAAAPSRLYGPPTTGVSLHL